MQMDFNKVVQSNVSLYVVIVLVVVVLVLLPGS